MYEDNSYYSSDSDSQSKKSDESMKKLTRKLEALKNNQVYEEKEEIVIPEIQNEEQQFLDESEYKLDSSVSSANALCIRSASIQDDAMSVKEEYDEEFEVISNTFNSVSQTLKLSQKSKNGCEEEDHKAYTLTKTIKKDEKLVIADNKSLKRPVTVGNKTINPPKQTAKATGVSFTKSPGNQDVSQKRPSSAMVKIGIPKIVQDKAAVDNFKQKPTVHQLEQLQKRKEAQQSEKKIQKRPKLPEIGSKALKVNNFVNSVTKPNEASFSRNTNAISNRNDTSNNKLLVKEIVDDIFSQNDIDKGDQAVAGKSNETKIAEEKQRRQQLVKEQQTKRKNEVDNQEEKVKEILKTHKVKQEIMKEREDQLYVRDNVEKIQQKKQKKQNLQYEDDSETQEGGRKWVDVRSKNYSSSQTGDGGKDEEKLRDNILANLKQEEIELRKTKINSQATQKVNSREDKWDQNIAQKKGTINEISKIESEKNEIARENAAIREMKQREHKKNLEQLEIQKQQRGKANEFTQEGENNLKQRNRGLENIQQILNGEKAKDKKEKERNIPYEEEQKEKSEKDRLILKQLKVQLRQITEENSQIQVALSAQRTSIEKNQAIISQIKNRDGVVVLGNNKFTSYGLVPALNKAQSSSKSSDLQTTRDEEEHDSSTVADKMNESEMRQMTQFTVIELVVNKITDQGFSLADIFSLLDVNKDGILTIDEIDTNMHKLELKLTEEEIAEMIKIIDSNKDGVVNQFEFVKSLEQQLQSEREYRRVMGELKGIQNPIVLDERVLDLEVRSKILLRNQEKEEEKALQKGPVYEGIMAKLKKHETDYEQREKARSKKKDLKGLLLKASQLKIQLKTLEDQKSKSELRTRERMEAIGVNISKLTQELVNLSEIVLKAKHFVDRERNEYQKLVLKQVAIERLQEQITQQKRSKEEEQQKQAAKFQSNMKQRATNMQFEQQQRMGVQNAVGATMLLQKIYRGWKARALTKKKKEKMLRSVKFLGAFYWWFSKKNKARKIKMVLNRLIQSRKIFVFKLIQVILYHKQQRLAPALAIKALRNNLKISDYDVFVSKQAEIKLMVGVKGKGANDEVFDEEVSDQGVNQSQSIGFDGNESRFGLPMYEKSTKVGRNTMKYGFSVNELPAVMTLQRGYRRWRSKLRLESENNDTVIIFSMGGINPLCRFCQEKKVDVLCRSCEQCIFCQECFNKFHQSYHRRNHRFYDLNQSKYNRFEQDSDKKITEYKEEIFEIIKPQFNELKKKLSQNDLNTTLIPINIVEEYLEKIPGLVQQKVILEKAKMLVKMFLVPDETAKALFKAQFIEKKYNGKKKYIDHGMFIRFFLDLSEQE